MDRRLPLLLLPLLAAAAGCGSSSTTTASAPEVAAPVSTATAAATRALEVGGTDLRLGGAVSDDGAGPRELAGASRPDPGALRRERRMKEGVGAGASCPDQDLQPTESNLPRVVDSTLCLLNGERADAGLGPLSTDDELAQAAIAHSRDMVGRSYFSHEAPDGTDSTARIRRTGYIPTDRAWTVGENLAWGTGNLATPRNIVVAWMNSPGHRANVLRPAFKEIGFGVVVGNPSRSNGQGATYTTTFGSLGGGGRTGGGSGTGGGSTTTTPTTGGGQGATAGQTGKKAKKAKKRRNRKNARRFKNKKLTHAGRRSAKRERAGRE